MDTTNPSPVQAVEQQLLENTVTTIEEINQAVPTLAIITHEEKNALAGQIWLDSGGIPDDPQTMDNWLLAESALITRAQAEYNG